MIQRLLDKLATTDDAGLTPAQAALVRDALDSILTEYGKKLEMRATAIRATLATELEDPERGPSRFDAVVEYLRGRSDVLTEIADEITKECIPF